MIAGIVTLMEECTESGNLLDKVYNYFYETSSVFRMLSMDEQGRISNMLIRVVEIEMYCKQKGLK